MSYDTKKKHLVTFIDLTSTLISRYKVHTYNLLHPLGSLLAKFGFTAIVSHISAADKVNSDNFDLWSDLNLTCDFLKDVFNLLENTR